MSALPRDVWSIVWLHLFSSSALEYVQCVYAMRALAQTCTVVRAAMPSRCASDAVHRECRRALIDVVARRCRLSPGATWQGEPIVPLKKADAMIQVLRTHRYRYRVHLCTGVGDTDDKGARFWQAFANHSGCTASAYAAIDSTRRQLAQLQTGCASIVVFRTSALRVDCYRSAHISTLVCMPTGESKVTQRAASKLLSFVQHVVAVMARAACGGSALGAIERIAQTR